MEFKEILFEKIKGRNKELDELLEKLPSGFQKIGDIIVLNLDKSLINYKKIIGETVLNLYKVRTVCNKFGEIKGKFREPQIEVIAGDKNTITTHVENNCKYKFDIRKVMFAKGNLNERIRIAKQVKKDEIIVDMFAGLGYFSVPIGKLSKAKKIYSIELNPVSFGFLKENLKINHIHNTEAINGDNRMVVDELVKNKVRADRVLMGYLPPPKEFLPWAFKIIERNGILHYEDLINVDNKEREIDRVINDIRKVAENYDYNVELKLAKKVKSYGPKIDHYVFDIIVK